MRSDALPWVLVCGLLVALFVMRGLVSASTARLEEARDSIAKLEPRLAESEAHAAELMVSAFKQDTVLIVLTDTVQVTIERAREDASAATDSLRATLDSLQAVQLDSIESAHEREVSAVLAVADQRLLWGQGWRDAAFAKDSALVVAQALADQYRAFSEVQAEQVRSVTRQRNLSVAVNVALAVVGAVR